MRTKRKIINLFEDKNIFSVKYVISVDKEEDLNQFWNLLAHSNSSSHCLTHTFIGQFYNFALDYVSKYDSTFFEIILEENEEYFYFTIWNKGIATQFKEYAKKAALVFLHDSNKISIKLTKVKCQKDIENLNIQNQKREKRLLNSVLEEYENKVMAPYDFIERDDLEELLKLNEDLQEFIYKANKASLDEKLFISFRSALSMFCLTIRYYKEISPIASTITEFSNLVNTNKERITGMDSSELALISGFVNNIETWINTLFVKGGADLHFMDNSMIADLNTISRIIVGFEDGDMDMESNLDDIFEF